MLARLLLLSFAAGLLSLAGPRHAAAQYVPPEASLVVGRPVQITLPAPSDTLTVTYRPNSSIDAVEHVAPAAGSASLTWTPREAGVVQLTSSGGPAQNVSVRFSTPPISGILVLTLAGLILFGGAVFAFRKLFAPDQH